MSPAAVSRGAQAANRKGACLHLADVTGTLVVDAATGRPCEPPEAIPEGLRDIERVDVEELARWLLTIPDGLSIELSLGDVGVFLVGGGYEPAQPDSRDMALALALAR